MLQVHAGSIWIGQKIVEKVREHSQTTMRRNLFVRITLDKVCLNNPQLLYRVLYELLLLFCVPILGISDRLRKSNFVCCVSLPSISIC